MKNLTQTCGSALLLRFLLSCGLCFFSFPPFAQPSVQWGKTIGGSSEDFLFSTTPTPDGEHEREDQEIFQGKGVISE